MEHSTRREALGTLGSLLGALVLSLVPGASSSAAEIEATAKAATVAPVRDARPSTKPPMHAVKRNG